jgi:phthalate 4,5-cis-dihydrodiol dehydrogenase
MPNGVMIYKNGVGDLDPLPPPAIPRTEVIDELYDAVVGGTKPVHSGEWAMATLEICLAMQRSSREGQEIALKYQG